MNIFYAWRLVPIAGDQQPPPPQRFTCDTAVLSHALLESTSWKRTPCDVFKQSIFFCASLPVSADAYPDRLAQKDQVSDPQIYSDLSVTLTDHEALLKKGSINYSTYGKN